MECRVDIYLFVYLLQVWCCTVDRWTTVRVTSYRLEYAIVEPSSAWTSAQVPPSYLANHWNWIAGTPLASGAIEETVRTLSSAKTTDDSRQVFFDAVRQKLLKS